MLSAELAELFLPVIFRAVKDGGQRVHIPGIGVFYLATTKPRRIRNAITGKLIIVPETWRIGFRASKHWKGGVGV